ncbi:MAG: hypothetical protein RBU45_00600 [Myxococcota bacterium]|jgi:D-alanine-D-alanine ligase|nr:hypothetical protein [Myxococcota bacterium]
MPATLPAPDIPVILLYSLDPQWEPEERTGCRAEAAELVAAMAREGRQVRPVEVASLDPLRPLRGLDPSSCVIFNWCESLPGIPRSDALIAQALEEAGFTFTGSTAAVLAQSWEKLQVKLLLDQEGIPTPRWMLCQRPGLAGWNRYPAIVKPCREHCSVGLDEESVALGPVQLRHQIARILLQHRQPVLVEEFLDGREVHITVWGDGRLELLPAAEMDFSAFGRIQDRLCNFDSKYVPGSSHYEQITLRLPAPLTAREQQQLTAVCLATYRALGCRDYARIDLRQAPDGTFLVLDVNPNADLCRETSMAQSAELLGLSWGAMAVRLVDLALQRHPAVRRRGPAPAARPPAALGPPRPQPASTALPTAARWATAAG